MQIAKSTARFTGSVATFVDFVLNVSAEAINTYDWKIDKGIPYPFAEGRNVIVNPSVPGKNAIFTDTPGVVISSWLGQTLTYLKQDWELHFVCLAGLEKDATYGGFKWGHTFRIKSLSAYLNQTGIDGYTFTSYATPIHGPASAKWIELYKKASIELYK